MPPPPPRARIEGEGLKTIGLWREDAINGAVGNAGGWEMKMSRQQDNKAPGQKGQGGRKDGGVSSGLELRSSGFEIRGLVL